MLPIMVTNAGNSYFDVVIKLWWIFSYRKESSISIQQVRLGWIGTVNLSPYGAPIWWIPTLSLPLLPSCPILYECYFINPNSAIMEVIRKIKASACSWHLCIWNRGLRIKNLYMIL